MAQRKYAEAVDITTAIALDFINLVLKPKGVEYYVAPYEADAQLAYLFLTGRAQAVITEDSDLLIFGVRRVLFKMDKQSGNVVEIDLAKLHEVDQVNASNQNSTLNTTSNQQAKSPRPTTPSQPFCIEMLLICCIVSGCDYLESIKGIGFKKAHKLVSEHGQDIKEIMKAIRKEARYQVPNDYERTFEKALLTFKF